MKERIFCVALLMGAATTFIAFPVGADNLAAKVKEVLAKDPQVVFKENLEKGSVNWVSVPLCVPSMPGFDYSGYRGPRPEPDSLIGQRGKACYELLGKERYWLHLKLEQWASEYNKLVNEYKSQ